MAGCWQEDLRVTLVVSQLKNSSDNRLFFSFLKSKESQLTTLKAVIHIIKHRAGEADSAASAEKSHSIQNVQ